MGMERAVYLLRLRTSYGALAQSGHDKVAQLCEAFLCIDKSEQGTLLGAPHGVFAAVSNQERDHAVTCGTYAQMQDLARTGTAGRSAQERGPTSAFTGVGP